jgi:hypothetical protein
MKMKFIIQTQAEQFGPDLQLVSQDGYCVHGDKARLVRALRSAQPTDTVTIADRFGHETVMTVEEYRRM